MKFSASGLKTFFEKAAESSFGEPAKTLEWCLRHLPKGARILDLGAGDGRNALYLAKHGFRVKAVDLSEAGILKLERLANEQGLQVETEVADAATYRIQEQWDGFVVVLLFQFLAEKDSRRLLEDMKEKTIAGGLHVIHVFTNTGDRQRLDREEDANAHCFYPEDGWLKRFYEGWEIVEYSSSSSPLIGKKRADGSDMMNVVEKIVVRKPSLQKAA